MAVVRKVAHPVGGGRLPTRLLDHHAGTDEADLIGVAEKLPTVVGARSHGRAGQLGAMSGRSGNQIGPSPRLTLDRAAPALLGGGPLSAGAGRNPVME
jgi:hypothetical protein